MGWRRNRSPVLSPLRESESSWRDNQLAIAGLLARAYLGSCEEPPSVAELDALMVAWSADGSPDRVEANTVVNAVGIAVGEALRHEAGLTWVVAEDAGGAELALHRPVGDVLIYPANAVAKRVTAAEAAFVAGLFAFWRDELAEVRARG